MLTLIFDSSTDLAFVGKWMGLQTKMRYEQLEGVKKVKKVSSIWSDTPSLHNGIRRMDNIVIISFIVA